MKGLPTVQGPRQPKRTYVKRSAKWNKKTAASSTVMLVPTVKKSTFDQAIEEMEEMTGHKFTPSEIVRISKWI
jgi:uncharacterized protein (DUF169 family)